jgi:hypothetical protein
MPTWKAQTQDKAMSEIQQWHGTTILTVRKNGKVVIAGDGQVSIGQTVIKSNAKKVRPLGSGLVIAGFAGAQSPSPGAPSSGAPYTEQSVWDITMVKTKPGLDDDYLRGIAQTLKGTMEEEKKQGVIIDYKVLIGEASNRDDFNILIMVEYKNMAAFDGLREKTEPIMAKVMGGQDAQRQLAVKRLDVREILGTKTMREVILK